MKSMRRALFVACPVFLLAGLNGCFTEVGNPEDETQMTASFQMDYTRSASVAAQPDSASILEFRLVLKDAEYQDTDSTQGTLWQNAKGYPVDFTGTDSQAVLPAQSLKSGNLANLALDFNFLSRKSVQADTLNFAAFQDPGYVKGVYTLHGAPVEFLFELPDTASDLTLKYSQAALQGWRENGAYRCQFSFLVFQWLSSADLTQAVADTDKAGKSLVLFDPQHNAALYSALTAGFYRAFNSQQVYWDTTGSTP